MNNQERLEIIEEAMDMIMEAQNLVDAAVDDTNIKSNYTAYGKYGFNQLLGNGNPYDSSLYSLIKEFDDDGDE